MKVDEIKPGQIFVIDNALIYPKLKLHNGFIDMRTQYIYSCKGDVQARLVSETQLKKIMSDWRMNQEEFEKYKQMLIKRQSGEDKVKNERG